MQVSIEWRKRAEQRLDSNTKQCLNLFGEYIAAQAYLQTKRHALLLANNPYMGPLEPLLAGRRRAYRSLVVHEHFKLIYYVDEKKSILYIVDIWDTRREPSALAHGICGK